MNIRGTMTRCARNWRPNTRSAPLKGGAQIGIVVQPAFETPPRAPFQGAQHVFGRQFLAQRCHCRGYS